MNRGKRRQSPAGRNRPARAGVFRWARSCKGQKFRQEPSCSSSSPFLPQFLAGRSLLSLDITSITRLGVVNNCGGAEDYRSGRRLWSDRGGARPRRCRATAPARPQTMAGIKAAAKIRRRRAAPGEVRFDDLDLTAPGSTSWSMRTCSAPARHRDAGAICAAGSAMFRYPIAGAGQPAPATARPMTTRWRRPTTRSPGHASEVSAARCMLADRITCRAGCGDRASGAARRARRPAPARRVEESTLQAIKSAPLRLAVMLPRKPGTPWRTRQESGPANAVDDIGAVHGFEDRLVASATHRRAVELRPRDPGACGNVMGRNVFRRIADDDAGKRSGRHQSSKPAVGSAKRQTGQ